MRKIISSLDVGSDTIKLVVGEFTGNRLHILGTSKIENRGMEAGKIVDSESVSKAIKKSVKQISANLGVSIEKAILGINPLNLKLTKSTSEVSIKNENSVVTGDDVSLVIKKCADGLIDEGYALIGVIPVEFGLDGDRYTKDPKGIVSSILKFKGIVITSPKDYVSKLLSTVESAGIKVIDIIPNALGDYAAFKNDMTEKSVGAIINVGYDTTSISIFNRGILTNNKTYKIGAHHIETDLAYIEKLDDTTSKAIYKDLCLATDELASPNEYRMATDLDGNTVRVNQLDVSAIAKSRIEEILNLAKKQINILTKKKISYIIILGGLTELRDFRIILESVLGQNVKIGALNMIGARDNSLSSAVGLQIYFEDKVALRGKEISTVNANEINENSNGKSDIKDNSLFSKVFGYFFDS